MLRRSQRAERANATRSPDTRGSSNSGQHRRSVGRSWPRTWQHRHLGCLLLRRRRGELRSRKSSRWTAPWLPPRSGRRSASTSSPRTGAWRRRPRAGRLGDWPPTRTPFLTLESLAAVSVTATGGNACHGLSAGNIDGKSPIVWNAARVRLPGGRMPTCCTTRYRCRRSFSRCRTTTSPTPLYFTNWGLNRDFDLEQVAATVGQIFAAAEAGRRSSAYMPPAALASSRIEVTVLVAPLVLASEVSGVVKPGHINYYVLRPRLARGRDHHGDADQRRRQPAICTSTPSRRRRTRAVQRRRVRADVGRRRPLTVQVRRRPDRPHHRRLRPRARDAPSTPLVLSETDSLVPATASGSSKRFVVPAGEYRPRRRCPTATRSPSPSRTLTCSAQPTRRPPCRAGRPAPPAAHLHPVQSSASPRLDPAAGDPDLESQRRTRGRPTRSRRSGTSPTRGRGTSTWRWVGDDLGRGHSAECADRRARAHRRPSRWWRRGAPTR